MARTLGYTSAYALAYVAGCVVALASGRLIGGLSTAGQEAIAALLAANLLAIACGCAGFTIAWGRLSGTPIGPEKMVAAFLVTLAHFVAAAGLVYGGVITPLEAQVLFLIVLFMAGRFLIGWCDG